MTESQAELILISFTTLKHTTVKQVSSAGATSRGLQIQTAVSDQDRRWIALWKVRGV